MQVLELKDKKIMTKMKRRDIISELLGPGAVFKFGLLSIDCHIQRHVL